MFSFQPYRDSSPFCYTTPHTSYFPVYNTQPRYTRATSSPGPSAYFLSPSSYDYAAPAAVPAPSAYYDPYDEHDAPYAYLLTPRQRAALQARRDQQQQLLLERERQRRLQQQAAEEEERERQRVREELALRTRLAALEEDRRRRERARAASYPAAGTGASAPGDALEALLDGPAAVQRRRHAIERERARLAAEEERLKREEEALRVLAAYRAAQKEDNIDNLEFVQRPQEMQVEKEKEREMEEQRRRDNERILDALLGRPSSQSRSPSRGRSTDPKARRTVSQQPHPVRTQLQQPQPQFPQHCRQHQTQQESQPPQRPRLQPQPTPIVIPIIDPAVEQQKSATSTQSVSPRQQQQPATPARPSPQEHASAAAPVLSPAPAPTSEQAAAGRTLLAFLQRARPAAAALRAVRAVEVRFEEEAARFKWPERIEFAVGGEGQEVVSAEVPVDVVKPLEEAAVSAEDGEMQENPAPVRVPDLAYTPPNAPLHAYFEALARLLAALDEVPSGGHAGVRRRRREVVRRVERAVGTVERGVRETWESWVKREREEKEEERMEVEQEGEKMELEHEQPAAVREGELAPTVEIIPSSAPECEPAAPPTEAKGGAPAPSSESSTATEPTVAAQPEVPVPQLAQPEEEHTSVDSAPSASVAPPVSAPELVPLADVAPYVESRAENWEGSEGSFEEELSPITPPRQQIDGSKDTVSLAAPVDSAKENSKVEEQTVVGVGKGLEEEEMEMDDWGFVDEGELFVDAM